MALLICMRGGKKNLSEGNGLGLAIVKKMIDMMNGTIKADSVPGSGLKVEICLYTDGADELFEAEKKVQDRAEQKKRPNQYDFTGKKILVAEDDELFIDLISVILERHGMLVDKTYDGNEVTDLFIDSREGEYDAILMDLHMPGMDGIRAVHCIRKSGRRDAGTIPILIYTGMPIEDTESFLAEHEIQAVVPKVFAEDELAAIFAELFGMAEHDGELK